MHNNLAKYGLYVYLDDFWSKLKNVISICVWIYYIKSFTGLVTKMFDYDNQYKHNKIYIDIIPIWILLLFIKIGKKLCEKFVKLCTNYE